MKNNKEEIIVIIDTSVLKSVQHFNSTHMKSLIDLSKQKLLKIYFPYMIYKEYISSLKEEHDKIKNKLNNIKKFLYKLQWLNNDYNNLQCFNIDMFDKLKNEIELNFKNFCEKNYIEIIPFNNSHCNQVIENYFKGLPPFEQIKSRKDIPDAFIFEEIKQLSNSNKIYFLVKDNNLKKQLTDLKNINTFESLENLIQNKAIQNLIIQNKREEFKNKILEKLLLEYEIYDKVYELIKEKEINEVLNGNELEIKNCITYNYDYAYVDYVESPKEISIDFERSHYLDKNKIAIPINLISSTNIDIYIYKSDYYGEMEYIPSVSEWNDHYFITEQQIDLLIETNLIINIEELNIDINKDKTIDENILIDNLKIEIDNNYEIRDILCNNYFTFKCEKCNKLHIVNCDILDWEEIERNERGMGLEILKESYFYENCYCGNNIEITFQVWEYPLGSINYTHIESIGIQKDNIKLNCNLIKDYDE
jgi:hypothetical protein